MHDSMRAQLAQHVEVVRKLGDELTLLEKIADRLISCFDSNGTAFTLGNGGSAADAQHIAAELVGRFKSDRKALPAFALTTDTSVLTAVSNDLGFQESYIRQIDAHVTSNDVVWALSVSGRSPNVLRAVERARELGAAVIGFTGKNGGPLAEMSDLALVVDHADSDRVQEAHQVAYHLVCDRVERNYTR